MDHQFWHDKWEKNEIGFHQDKVNRMLARHLSVLEPRERARILLPLCGKTLDIEWLLSNGYHVIGSELSELAIIQLFEDLGAEPTVTALGCLKQYSTEDLDIFVGDFFALAQDHIGAVDATYDRAALVALPGDLRRRYADHLAAITDHAPQLLISFEYDQSEMAGPPFSITADEVTRLYDAHYALTLLDSADVPGGLKGKCPATETAWHLRRKKT